MRLILLVIALLFFLFAGAFGFGWFGTKVVLERIVGVIAFGLAIYTAAHLVGERL